jgi:hypothetical protein
VIRNESSSNFFRQACKGATPALKQALSGQVLVTRSSGREGNEAAYSFERDSGELRRYFGRGRWLFGCLNDR